MTLTPPAVPDTLDFCCGGKKCPVLRDLGPEGFEIVDTDQTADPIRLTREQAAALAPWILQRLAL